MLGQVVHFVMPDLSCRTALVTGGDAESGVLNMVVFRDGLDDQAMPSHPGHLDAGPVRAAALSAHRARVHRPVEVPPLEPVDWGKAQADWDAAEAARVEAATAAAKTEAEKADIVAAKPFVPPSAEEVEKLEEERAVQWEKEWDSMQAGTWHAAEEHDAHAGHVAERKQLAAKREAAKAEKAAQAKVEAASR